MLCLRYQFGKHGGGPAGHTHRSFRSIAAISNPVTAGVSDRHE
jgi:hypothetical protein